MERGGMGVTHVDAQILIAYAIDCAGNRIAGGDTVDAGRDEIDEGCAGLGRNGDGNRVGVAAPVVGVAAVVGEDAVGAPG